MNDDEVVNEMKKMVKTTYISLIQVVDCWQVAFIKQEAMEKAREIKVKADEEFAIEKVVKSSFPNNTQLIRDHYNQAKLVKQETSAIDAQFEKKRKAGEVAQRT